MWVKKEHLINIWKMQTPTKEPLDDQIRGSSISHTFLKRNVFLHSYRTSGLEDNTPIQHELATVL